MIGSKIKYKHENFKKSQCALSEVFRLPMLFIAHVSRVYFMIVELKIWC